jgi:hypothetical protein
VAVTSSTNETPETPVPVMGEVIDTSGGVRSMFVGTLLSQPPRISSRPAMVSPTYGRKGAFTPDPAAGDCLILL